MAKTRTTRTARAPWITAGAVVGVLAVVGTLAAVWPGYDAQQTPLDDASVWVLQSGEGRRYARVNTELRELDTVKQVENPSGLAQTANRLFVFADGDTRYADVSMATPTDLGADAAESFQQTPSGTVAISSAGDHIVYRTDAGDVYVASMTEGGSALPVDPYADVQVPEGQERPRFVADTAAVSPDGTVVAYSRTQGRVIRADAGTGKVTGGDDIDAGTPQDPQITMAGGRWALLDPANGALWLQGRSEPIATGAAPTARLQRAGPDADAVYLADADGLTRVDPSSGAVSRVAQPQSPGVPAAPDFLGGVVYAAWLSTGTGGGALWSSADGIRPLDYAGGDLSGDPAPEFRGNGARLLLNETRSGWVWTVPDGALVPSSQAWESKDQVQQQQQDDLASERVVDPRPPVAVNDTFGVRAGRDVVLPVLLNDHDPNEDVLSVVPTSVTGLSPSFGTVTVAHAEQQLVVSVQPDARGGASFTYQVTDGTSADGLLSNVATVTLNVVPDDVNNPPVWCGVEGCLATWPEPQVSAGGTVSVSTLDAWVDPDGDPIYLAGAVNQAGVGSVAADPDGTVTYQHPDPNAADAVSVPLALTVSDARGATAEKVLTVTVTPTPKLTAQSFAAVGVAGQPLTVELAGHVSGAHGAVTLATASVVNDAGASLTTNPAALRFAFQAGSPGSYVVQYTVRDDLGEATGTARITLRAPQDARISSPPLTAFVRPSEDTTVDVLRAVTNPTGAVLLVSDLRAEADPLASLSVDLVGQSLLRVSGSTENGQPGTLGVVRYTISDGTGAAATTAQGEITVILLPAATAEPPIAVDDAVTVRTGTQIDIPVLANDTAPAGAQIAVDPSSVVNESGAGLAFATPRLVRYLAPTQPGSYSLSYTIFRVGFPEMTDSARILITVLAPDVNTAPVPRPLEGRVLSGSSVSIPFDAFEVDPDGDAVTLDRIVTQPASGSAAISVDGDAIVYTSRPGTSGQDTFTYQVRDALGATGTAEVRIGILDAQSDPSPVTYSDYVQVQAGADAEAVVHPADNDVDPAGGRLELVDVHPNAQADTAEYASLAAQLGQVDTATGKVVLRAGTELGTFSFVYTVRNAAGDTAMGLIVMKVVRGSVPDYPVVTDTILTAETRDQLPDGIDVLAGKVSWSGGDVAGLTLSLWGDAPAGVSVSGWRISGPVPAKTQLIPFQITGTSFSGQQVVSYGFLRVPGDQDIRLALRPGAPAVQVDERKSVDVDLAPQVLFPRGATLQVDPGGVTAGGARAEARCALVSGTTIRYDAGGGAPWDDTCVVPVKISTQTDWTYLSLRVSIVAADPQPVLRPASVSVSPGSTTTYDLRQMTGWAGREDWSRIAYAIGYAGDQFEVSLAGSQLTIRAKDASRPGREEPVTVSVPSHPLTAAANLTLTVGPAPSTLPKGGTVTQQCSQAGGSTSCTIPVVGGGGEVNPLPGTPLTLVSVAGATNCAGVAFSVANATTVQASWRADAPGAGDCTGSFVVADAQGRQSSGDRNGQVVLDLQGLPSDPGRMNWTSYTGSSVTLRVVPGANSYPAVTGFRVAGSNGAQVTCSASGECPPIPATNGQKVTYQAWAVNSVGESRKTASIEAWAYQAPAAPRAVTAEPSGDQTATITVDVSDDTTGFVRLRVGGRDTSPRAVSAPGKVVFDSVDVGSNTGTTVTAIPTTRFERPPDSIVAGGSSDGQTKDVEAWGIGKPILDPIGFADSDISGFRGSVTVTATVSTPNAKNAQLYLGVSDSASSCTPATAISDVVGRTSKTYDNLVIWTSKIYSVCAEYRYNGRSFGVSQQQDVHTLTGDIPKPQGDATYKISLGGADGDASREASLTAKPTLKAGSDDFEVVYFNGGDKDTDFARLLSRIGSAPDITAKTCRTDGDQCSSAVAVTTDGAEYLVTATFAKKCGDEPEVVNPGGTASRDWSFTKPTVASPVAKIAFKGALSAFGTITYEYTNCTAAPGGGTGGTGGGTGGTGSGG